ncbi:MAG: DUF4065 domain-containing protein [Firmicutes bacterium]|nr:DUF4065 domain-containing protein [Bacillota bacterium]
MAYSAYEIAKYVVTKCTEDNSPISNLQLQKILYFLQIEFLRNRGEQLFVDDFEAWQFGPVVPDVYYKFCGFGAMKIRMHYDCEIDFDDNTKTIIDSIVEKKRILNPWDLVDDTHMEGKAWDTIFRDGQGNHQIIPKEMIRQRG